MNGDWTMFLVIDVTTVAHNIASRGCIGWRTIWGNREWQPIRKRIPERLCPSMIPGNVSSASRYIGAWFADASDLLSRMCFFFLDLYGVRVHVRWLSCGYNIVREWEKSERGKRRPGRTMMGDKAQTPSGTGIAYHSHHRSCVSVRGDKPWGRGR